MFDASKLKGFLSQVSGIGSISGAQKFGGGEESEAFAGFEPVRSDHYEQQRSDYEQFPVETGPEVPDYGPGFQSSFEGDGSLYQRQAAEVFQDIPEDEDFSKGENLDEHGAEKAKITPFQAAWNITNAIQGMFIVSLPYAILHGGWWAVAALLGVAAICYYTGLLLVECLYEDGKRVRSSYRAIAEECWGKPWGGRIVLGAQLTELLMTCILYMVLAGDLLEGSFPDAAMDKMGWMLLSAAILLPCAFIMDLRAVSTLSFWNTVSHVVINLIILLYCLSQAGSWNFKGVKFTFSMETFPTVLGIVVFSYTSHIFLPSLEGSLTDRSAFQPMLKWTHIAAGLFKALFGLLGFMTFSAFTQEEVTNNLPSQQFKVIVNLILVVKALLSYPLPFFATVQIIQEEFFRGPPKTRFPLCLSPDKTMREWALSLRICLVLFTLFMALSIPHFALLMGLVGNITGTMLSFIWPSLFHLQLKGASVTGRQRAGNIAIIATGVLFGVIGIYYSSVQLSRAINYKDVYA